MLEIGHKNLDDASQKYCISWYSLQVASAGSSMVVAAWNCHPIPGKKGIPTQRMLEKNYVSKLNDLKVVPSVDDAQGEYKEAALDKEAVRDKEAAEDKEAGEDTKAVENKEAVESKELEDNKTVESEKVDEEEEGEDEEGNDEEEDEEGDDEEEKDEEVEGSEVDIKLGS
uniref:Uncharacterized protein n=1 Tax=Amphimedon queenslandica TaxID=400682 RepID=A0A1X7TFZ7_AMPQE